MNTQNLFNLIFNINNNNILLGGDYSANLQELCRVHPKVFSKINSKESELVSFLKKFFVKNLYKIFDESELLDDPILPCDFKELILSSKNEFEKNNDYGDLLQASSIVYFGKLTGELNDLDHLMIIIKLLFPCYLFELDSFLKKNFSNQVFNLDNYRIDKQDSEKSVIKTTGYSGQHIIDSNKIYSNDMRLIRGNEVLRFNKFNPRKLNYNKISFSSESFISNNSIIKIYHQSEPDYCLEVSKNNERSDGHFYVLDFLSDSNRKDTTDSNCFKTSDLEIIPIKYNHPYGNFSLLKELYENKS